MSQSSVCTMFISLVSKKKKLSAHFSNMTATTFRLGLVVFLLCVNQTNSTSNQEVTMQNRMRKKPMIKKKWSPFVKKRGPSMKDNLEPRNSKKRKKHTNKGSKRRSKLSNSIVSVQCLRSLCVQCSSLLCFFFVLFFFGVWLSCQFLFNSNNAAVPCLSHSYSPFILWLFVVVVVVVVVVVLLTFVFAFC